MLFLHALLFAGGPALDPVSPDPNALYPFRPGRQPEQITAVNRRTPERPDCVTRSATAQWPTTMETPEAVLVEKLQTSGATQPGVALIELDREFLEAALQISVAEGRLRAERTQAFRDYADQHILKEGTRVYVLSHSWNSAVTLEGPGEPSLITERSGQGRLVALSMNLGLGLEAGAAGMLAFEDFVCVGDTGHAVRLPGLTPANHSSRNMTLQFTPQDSALALLGPILQPSVPSAPQEPRPTGRTYDYGYTARSGGSADSWDFFVDVAGLALGVAGLIVPFL